MGFWESTDGNPAIDASQCAGIAGISSGGELTHAWTNEVSLVLDLPTQTAASTVMNTETDWDP